jgi:hypothetical protein
MNEEEKIKKQFLDLATATIKMQNDFNDLLQPYDSYFASAFKHSEKLNSYLLTWAKLEKEMSIQLREDQRQKVEELVAYSAAITAASTNAVNQMLAVKKSIFKLNDHFVSTASFIGKTFPDAKRCYEAIEKLEGLYKTEFDLHLKLKDQLPVLSSALNKAVNQLKAMMD